MLICAYLTSYKTVEYLYNSRNNKHVYNVRFYVTSVYCTWPKAVHVKTTFANTWSCQL
jgi:hypothetical protein